jgi:7-cyano-7-deazaguanine tRNA-ribosyltransferase
LLIVAGLNLNQIHPKVWDKTSPYYLEDLKAVMFSYAQIHQKPKTRTQMMNKGIRAFLNIPEEIKIYLDNGAFNFAMKGFDAPVKDYEDFVEETKPDWKPIPQDFIPAPKMTVDEQSECLRQTMDVNLAFKHDGFVPVIHISKVLQNYILEIKNCSELSQKKSIAIGGIVPNLLRAPKALPHSEILRNLIDLRKEFSNRTIHIFGIGGISTLHLAALLEIDSVDSSGWRNRAARGIILLPGKTERTISELGSWHGRKLDEEDEKALTTCDCPACLKFGIEGLKLSGTNGFSNRATHNLWVLLQENKWIQEKMTDGSYSDLYKERVQTSSYRLLLDELVEKKSQIISPEE